MSASSPPAPSPPAVGTPAGRLRSIRRSGEGARVAGVCAGVARAFGVDATLVRVALIVGALVTSGGALALYLLAWALLPADADAPAGPESLGWRAAVGAGLLAAAAVLALQELGAAPASGHLIWPVVITTAGVVLLWRASVPARGTSGGPPPGLGLGLGPRTLAGIGLVAGGLVALLQATNAIGTLRDLVVATAIVLAGVTLIFGTSWLGLLSTLREERAQRIRSDERAEMAAHLHDSVLQTLSLIQRRAGDDREIAHLARRQERELRDWLAGRAGSRADGAMTLSDALRRLADDVEERHDVRVEVVTVGDTALDEHVEAIVRAASEAAVNAAKFAGTGRVDVYAEADDDRVEVFVRDRGTGFDPAAVPVDRRGVRESIVGRMERHGGHAEIRSAPGEGTEVELVLERRKANA